MEILKNKFMNSIAFIILHSIINSLIIVLYSGGIKEVCYYIIALIHFDKITDRIYLLKILSLINNLQFSLLKTFIISSCLSAIISIIITLILWNIVKIFKNNVNFQDTLYVTGIWCITMFFVTIVSIVLFYINIKIAVIFYIISAIIDYIYITYNYLWKVNRYLH